MSRLDIDETMRDLAAQLPPDAALGDPPVPAAAVRAAGERRAAWTRRLVIVAGAGVVALALAVATHLPRVPAGSAQPAGTPSMSSTSRSPLAAAVLGSRELAWPKLGNAEPDWPQAVATTAHGIVAILGSSGSEPKALVRVDPATATVTVLADLRVDAAWLAATDERIWVVDSQVQARQPGLVQEFDVDGALVRTYDVPPGEVVATGATAYVLAPDGDIGARLLRLRGGQVTEVAVVPEFAAAAPWTSSMALVGDALYVAGYGSSPGTSLQRVDLAHGAVDVIARTDLGALTSLVPLGDGIGLAATEGRGPAGGEGSQDARPVAVAPGGLPGAREIPGCGSVGARLVGSPEAVWVIYDRPGVSGILVQRADASACGDPVTVPRGDGVPLAPAALGRDLWLLGPDRIMHLG